MPVQVTTSGRLPTQVWDAQASAEAADVLRDAIDERAFVRGLDASDRPLKPYSPATRRALAAAGQATRVDLQSTGALRASLRRAVVRIDEQGAVIEVPPDQAEKAAAVQETRPWWGISPSDVATLNDAMPSIFARAVERGGK